MVNFQSDVSPAKLKVMRSVFGGHSTTTFSGLGLPAFSSVQGTGSAKNNGLVVLKGGTAVEVFWGGPLAKIAALVERSCPPSESAVAASRSITSNPKRSARRWATSER